MKGEARTALVVERRSWLRDRLVGWLGREGFRVLACRGPLAPGTVCAGAEGAPCVLARIADVIVLDPDLAAYASGSSEPWRTLARSYASLPKPVLLLGTDEAVLDLASEPSGPVARILPRLPTHAALRHEVATARI